MAEKEEPRIIIKIDGGLIQDVIIPKGLNVTVETRDYDTEGYDGDDLVKDGTEEYFKQEYENKE